MSDLLSAAGRAALARLAAADVLFGFDFDGTLAPIQPYPDMVAMDARTGAAFAALTRCASVAVITGRAVADVRPRLTGAPLWVVGNHGAEGMPDADPAALARQLAVCTAWRVQLHAMGAAAADGIELEDKRHTLSLHYRRAPDQETARLRLADMVDRLQPPPQVVGGKCILNLLPQGASDKFCALQALVQGRGAPAFAFFMGDDENDEAVFRQAPPSWVTVKVGTGDTHARFRLRDQDSVADCLELLLALRLEACATSGRGGAVGA